jgi:hypothetical protein
MTHVKWLSRITAIDGPFQGYQQAVAYHDRPAEDDPGTPVSRIRPRSLMIPPGIPVFLTRRRRLTEGPCVLRGRAWSGWGPVERVEVSTDGGRTWSAATLEEPVSEFAWRGWWHRWDPPGPGDYELSSRAIDAAGNEQPLEPHWNVEGMSNNMAQRVAVTVVAAPTATSS